MILGFKKWSGLALTTLLFAYNAVAGEMPFPPIENGKVKLVVADSPYLLEPTTDRSAMRRILHRILATARVTRWMFATLAKPCMRLNSICKKVPIS